MTRIAEPLQLSPHVYLVYAEHPHRNCSNVYLVTGPLPLLIDCGSAPGVPYLLRNLARLGFDIRDIDRVVATHGHCDHLQAFHLLQQANPRLRLLIHPLDAPLMVSPNDIRNACHLYNGTFVPIVLEDMLPVVDGERIPAGEGELTVLHTPGHTEGSICLWGEIDGHRMLFAGDTVGGAMPGLEGLDLEEWVRSIGAWQASLRRIAALDIDWVLNGHEPAAGLPISRTRLDRSIASFGKMMNPWFSLADDEEDPVTSQPVEAT